MTQPQQPEFAHYQAANAALIGAATAQLGAQLAELDWNAASVQSAVTRLYGGLVRAYRGASSTLGLQLYGDLRAAADVSGGWRKITAPDPDPAWIDAKVASAFKVPAPQAIDIAQALLPGDETAGVFDVEQVVTDRLTNSMQRMILSGGRDAVALNAAEDGADITRVPDKPGAPVGEDPAFYVRVPTSMKPCAFCVMTASRNWRPYTSAQAAEFVVGTRSGAQRGKQPLGHRYHDHCQCIAVPVFRGKPTPFDRSPYELMYEKAAADAGTRRDTKKVLASMRQLYGLR
ncbi:hypothetical protein [Mycolicibacterium wolinskyi]|uniref:VG15 protein n=1 Tax=Mycolicibacterium wolinskyi TaxID=59750 RepID=UPI0039179CAF